MLTLFLNALNFIPDEYQKSVYDIDYSKLYENGVRLILTDLDNTLVSYDDMLPNEDVINLKNKLINMGFEIIIMSNNKGKRVKKFSEALDVKYVALSLKPLKIGFKRALKKASRKYEKKEIVILGDQLMTDIFSAKRTKCYTILVEAVKRKTEKLVTRINRKMERKVLKKIKRKYKEEYDLKLKEYVRINYGD